MTERRATAPAISLRGVRKEFPGGVVAVARARPGHRRRRVRHAARPVRLGQDHGAADDRRLRAADRRHACCCAAATSPPRRRSTATCTPSSRTTRCSRTCRCCATSSTRCGSPRSAGAERRERALRGAGHRPARRRWPTARPPRCPAGSASGWRWPARWSTGPPCCCSTSRSARSTSSCASRCRSSSSRSSAASGITFVLVTHDQDEALTLADRVVVFNDGRVEQAGPRTRSTSGRRRRSSPGSSAPPTCCARRRHALLGRDGTLERAAREDQRRVPPTTRRRTADHGGRGSSASSSTPAPTTRCVRRRSTAAARSRCCCSTAATATARRPSAASRCGCPGAPSTRSGCTSRQDRRPRRKDDRHARCRRAARTVALRGRGRRSASPPAAAVAGARRAAAAAAGGAARRRRPTPGPVGAGRGQALGAGLARLRRGRLHRPGRRLGDPVRAGRPAARSPSRRSPRRPRPCSCSPPASTTWSPRPATPRCGWSTATACSR